MVSFSLKSVAVAAILGGAHLAAAAPGTAKPEIKYTTVTGYFLQDEPTTDPASFDYIASNFGLINRTYPVKGCNRKGLTQWQKFGKEVERLNREAAKNVEYKLLFLGRHGEGWHNAAESFYGTPAWNCYWSLVNGNGTAEWDDPLLTPAGIKQAQIANAFWAKLIKDDKINTPDSYYSSPMQRCLATAELTFNGLALPKSKPFEVTVKEYLREGISIHTCDHRKSKSNIKKTFPAFKFERGFAETDPYWSGVTKEPSQAQDLRSKVALDDIFSSDKGSWISITSHSGEISSLLRVLGHRAFRLGTGAVIPVLVKAETLSQPAPVASATWGYDPHCTSPPVTSAAAGCVCQAGATPITEALVTVTPGVAPIQTFYPKKP